MNKTLVIMAAGMGSRFGGIKQIEPVGPNGEIISDYNIYNAIESGFNKVVFIIKKEHLNYFEENIVSKFKDKIKVEFAFQEFNSSKIPLERTKPLGTVHAILCAKSYINEPFVVINADDFYGKEAFKIASDFYDENNNPNDYLTVNFLVTSVMNESVEVKRGICYSENNKVTKIIESKVKYVDNEIHGEELDTGYKYIVDKNLGAAVNFFCFKPSVFEVFEKYYNNFLENINLDNEALLTVCISDAIDKKEINLYENVSDIKWYSITYKEDLIEFKKNINKLIENGEYPNNLWR